MSEVDRRYFDGLMAGKKLSLRGRATRMGMNHSQLSLAFSGARKLQLEEVAQLAQIFGEPVHRIIEAAGVDLTPDGGRRASVIGSVGSDGVITPYPAGTIERTSIPAEMPSDLVGIQFRTAGGPLAWMDGFVSFARPTESVDNSAIGRLCVVQIKDGPQVVATVSRGYREGTFNLAGPYVAESAVLTKASPVLFTRH